jgi:Carboxymuconolactone decarboxylase family
VLHTAASVPIYPQPTTEQEESMPDTIEPSGAQKMLGDFAPAKPKENRVTEQELIEAITHLAFYAGWPKAMSAMVVAKRMFRGE